MSRNKKGSGSSYETRLSLVRDHVVVPVVSDTTSFRKYAEFAKKLYNEAIQNYESDDLNLAYITLKRFLSLVVDQLPKHTKYKKEYFERMCKNAFELLEDVVIRMDQIEDDRIYMRSHEYGSDLLEEFDELCDDDNNEKQPFPSTCRQFVEAEYTNQLRQAPKLECKRMLADSLSILPIPKVDEVVPPSYTSQSSIEPNRANHSLSGEMIER